MLHCLQVCRQASGPEALQQACSSSLQFISSLAVQPGLPPPRGPEAVGRLVLQSLGGVDWLAAGCCEQQLEQQLARLVLQVKLAVQSSRSAAVITCHTGGRQAWLVWSHQCCCAAVHVAKLSALPVYHGATWRAVSGQSFTAGMQDTLAAKQPWPASLHQGQGW